MWHSAASSLSPDPPDKTEHTQKQRACATHATGIMFPFLAQFYPRNVIPGPGARSAEAAWEAVKDKVSRVYICVCFVGVVYG